MSKAVRSDGSVDRAFGKVIGEFDKYSKAELDELAAAMSQPVPGSRPKLDMCTLANLLGFGAKYRWKYRCGCRLVEKYILIKLRQSHIESYMAEERKNNPDPSDPMAKLLR